MDCIKPGLDFVTIREERVAKCDVLLALTGPRWLEATDRDGRPRLQDSEDFA